MNTGNLIAAIAVIAVFVVIAIKADDLGLDFWNSEDRTVYVYGEPGSQTTNNAVSNNQNTSSGSNTSVSVNPNTAVQPANNTGNNGGSTATSCGAITWGPAGPAPGVGTSDSAKQVADAVQLMQISLQDADHVTIHKFCPGDDTPNGWIVGSSWTESQGIRVTANFLPAGVCIDYDHNVTQVTGQVYHTQVLNPRWSRTQITSDGAASGLKFTVYWTPCAFTDGTPSWAGVSNATNQTAPAAPAVAVAPSQQDSAIGGCPATANDVAAITNTPNSWSKVGNEPCAWLYTGDAVSFAIPSGYEVDYDAGGFGGKKFGGETVPSGIVFTLRKL